MKLFNTNIHSNISHTLKSERTESYYAGSVMVWNDDTINSEWLTTYLEIFSRKVEIPKVFIDKYNVKQYHINLIRRMYFDSDDSDDKTNLAYKRPYGNSNVMFDVFDEYNKIEKVFDKIEESYDWVEKNYDFLQNIHNETMNIFDLMLNELYLGYDEWENIGRSWSKRWIPTKKSIRKVKLERIIK